jgi:predicted enzyme related to lactoylglutathione lyase
MTTIPTGRFVWFEYYSTEQSKAQAFFGEIFNWKTQDMPAPTMPGGKYAMIAVDNVTIGGYVPTPEGAPKNAHWIAHLQVADANAIAAKVKSAGGKVRKGPEKMGDFGTWAIVADPFDGTFALWQPGKAEGTGDYAGKVGTFCWNELSTEQPDKSVAFYRQIAGFEEERQDMGAMGTYHVLKSDGKPRAGVMKTPKPGVPQMWLPYVQVASADQTADKAKRLGAQIVAPPNDIPNVGRFAIFLDPLGAALGILQPKQ